LRPQPWAAKPWRSSLGFTLLELVIAMACVGLVAGGIALSISTCINVWNKAGEAAELNQEARAILELVSRDLRAVYFGLDQETGYLIEQSSQQQTEGPQPALPKIETLELATHGSALERFTLLPDELRGDWDLAARPPLTDYVEVSYQWVGETTDRVAGLYRMTSAVPFSGAKPTGEEEAAQEAEPVGLISQELISPSVSELQFEFYDGKDEQWVADWDSRANTGHPLWAVWVELKVKDARGRDHAFETTVPIPVY